MPTTPVPAPGPPGTRRLDETTLTAFRRLGYLYADLDPLHRLEPESQPNLEQEADAETAEVARRYYCGPIGVEFMHIPERERRRWIAARIESETPPPDRHRILDLILSAETYEQMVQ